MMNASDRHHVYMRHILEFTRANSWLSVEFDDYSQACVPDWFREGKSCPYGVDAGLPLSPMTWPHNPTWQHYIATFFSAMPFFMAFGIPMLFVLRRGTREIIGILLFWSMLPVMLLAKITLEMPRPLGSCLTSCGMPSGHALTAMGFFAWLTCEICFNPHLSSQQKRIVTSLWGILLLPVGWSRTVLGDHSWAQVHVGSLLGISVGLAWYVCLNTRLVAWILHAWAKSFCWKAIGGVGNYVPNHVSLEAEDDIGAFVEKKKGYSSTV